MKRLNLILVMIILLSIGCSKDDTIQSDCIQSMLAEHNMVAYNGQETGCKFFLELYHYQNKQFFLLGNHCADMVIEPVDCEGNLLCQEESVDFHNHAVRIGIIGIEE